MALPTRCTSLGPMWRNTAAASDSPRLSRKIAALSSLLSFCVRLASSLICIDPLFHDLCYPSRVFRQQALDGVELLLVAGARRRQQHRPAGRRGEADGIVAQVVCQQSVIIQGWIATAFTDRVTIADTETLQHRAQHAEYQHQHEQDTQCLLGDIPEPGLGPERHFRRSEERV